MGVAVATVRKVESAEAVGLSSVLARAFKHDPMCVHLLPGQARRASRLEQAFRMLLQRIYLPHQECYTLGVILGGALWSPPGKYPPSLWQQVSFLPGFPHLFGLWRTPRALRDLNLMEKMHPKEKPHWYLAFLGVDPPEQGKGVGSTLIQPVLERCDVGRVPAYLETSNERTLPLYSRHGFEVVKECDIPKGPHLWGMWREPQV